jgi:hypothetical protein
VADSTRTLRHDPEPISAPSATASHDCSLHQPPVQSTEADAHSDIDLAVVRPDDVDDDDEGWAESIDAWRRQVRTLTGNDVEIIEATASEATRKLRGRSELWRNIKRDGMVVYGRALDVLAG